MAAFALKLTYALGLFGAYYGWTRSDFWPLFACMALASAAALLFHKKLNFKELFILGFLARALGFWAWPGLSDDFYRFLWDGHLLWQGLHPMGLRPDELAAPSAEMQALYEGLNSKSYYSVYPWVSQGAFAWAVLLSPKHMLGALFALRLPLLLGELLVWRELKKANLGPAALAMYWLNPFVCLETIGNLHFEGLQLGFLLWAFRLWETQRGLGAGLLYGLSIQTKLTPLLLAPLIWAWQGKNWRSARILALGLAPMALGLLLLFWPGWNKMGQSLIFYFQYFEFNASIYYLLRAWGYWVWGYNQIALFGKILPLLLIAGLAYAVYRQKSQNTYFYKCATYLHTLHLLLAHIVHPWYWILPLGLGLRAGVWPLYFMPALAFLSYTAYEGGGAVQEQTWALLLEYVLCFLAFGFYFYSSNKVLKKT